MTIASYRSIPKENASLHVRCIFGFAVMLFVVLSLDNVALGATDCLKCHGDLVKKKVVHPAVQLGCPTCHSGIDATITPHIEKGGAQWGLSSAAPGLCYGCHDRITFTGKGIVHQPVKEGFCIFCHLPHQSDNEHLLRDKIPELCYECHTKNDFIYEYVHVPISLGKCMSCHEPHESDREFLLIGEINEVCLGCHSDIARKPHVEQGPLGGHPIGTKSAVTIGGKKTRLTCVSCHKPHSSPWAELLQYSPPVCEKCHKI